MVDATITAGKRAISRQPIEANTPFTVMVQPLDPLFNVDPRYAFTDRPVKIISYTGGPIWIRPGITCAVDDDLADQCAPGGYINAIPAQGLITLISDQDSIVSIIRRLP